MKTVLIAMAAPVLCSGLMFGQNNNMQSGMRKGQTWTGLLVAAGCDGGSVNQSSMQSSADRTTNMTMPQRTTTERETNTTYEQRVNQADRNTVSSSATNTNDHMDKTTEDYGAEDVKKYSGWKDWTNPPPNIASNSTAGQAGLQGWEAAQNIAQQMPASCRITASTTSFALRLKDGRVATFDSASNAKIEQKLRSRGGPGSQTKIYGVIATGDMQHGVITLNSIQL